MIFPPYNVKLHDHPFELQVSPDPKPYLNGEVIWIEPKLLPDDTVFSVWEKHLKCAGATIAKEYDGKTVTIAIVQNRSTAAYIRASRDAKLVGSLWWLTNTMLRQKFVAPFKTLIDYPVPKGRLATKDEIKVDILKLVYSFLRIFNT